MYAHDRQQARRGRQAEPARGGRKAEPARGGREAVPARRVLAPARALALVLALALLAACAQAPRQAAGSAGSGVAAKNDAFDVAVFYYDYNDVYVGSVRSSLEGELTQAGIPYTEYDAKNDQPTQNQQIDKAINAGADCLVVNIVSSGNAEKADAICQKANAAGIPVIFFNRPVEEAGYEGLVLDYYKNVAYVGTDAKESGRLQGQMIGTYVADHYSQCDLNGDGSISYVIFKGDASNVGSIYRTKYAVDCANEVLTQRGYPPLAYFDKDSVDKYQLDLTGSWSMESTEDYMMTDLLHFNEKNDNMIELVIANSDAMAEGAINALEAYGYNLGRGKDCITVPVFGIDASERGKRLIYDGKMTGTITQDPVANAHAIALLVENVAAGRDLFHGMEAYPRDEENGLDSKILLPYSFYDPSTYAPDGAGQQGSAEDSGEKDGAAAAGSGA